MQEVTAAIDALGLTRRFVDHTALDALTLQVPRNETFGLLGANGAGKTTFIRLVTGFLLPTDGEVTVDGISPSANPAGVRARVGFVMETSRLYPELRVDAFLRFAAGAHGLSGKPRGDAIERVVEQFSIGDVLRRHIGNLSKGYQQRVSLAQAFLHDPSVVIVDEPTSGLDPLQREDVHAILGALRGERTVLISTHDLAEARSLTSRVAVLHAGRLVTQGPTEQVLDSNRALSLFEAPEAGLT
ncbi:MAG: ABC transporter ATP-binding protein [Myxococcales bacterium]|nr:ABC transporter ATP-binding protein [Myxococcales bacterium]